MRRRVKFDVSFSPALLQLWRVAMVVVASRTEVGSAMQHYNLVNQRADASCKQEYESPIETTLPCSYAYERNELQGVGVYRRSSLPTTIDRVARPLSECIISVKMYVKSSKTEITLCLP